MASDGNLAAAAANAAIPVSTGGSKFSLSEEAQGLKDQWMRENPGKKISQSHGLGMY